MTLPVSKEQFIAKMGELDTILQMAVNVRTELYSMATNFSDNETFADIEIPLTFWENGHVIAWGDDSEHFSPASFGLLQQLWHAPNHILSKEDIRQDVIEDYEASDNAIWLRINSARQELRNVEFPYEIETLRGKGYRLTARKEPVQMIKG